MTITRALPPGYPSSWVGLRCRGGHPVNKNSSGSTRKGRPPLHESSDGVHALNQYALPDESPVEIYYLIIGELVCYVTASYASSDAAAIPEKS